MLKQNFLLAILLIIGLASCAAKKTKTVNQEPETNIEYKVATFAGGCFWCVEAAFEYADGVISADSGYMGGSKEQAHYEAVGSGISGHYEAVQVKYDPSKTNYKKLVELFWTQIDPTDADGQFADKGTQYMTAIFYHDDEQKQIAETSKLELAQSGKFDKDIVTKIAPAGTFYPAEDYHQNYFEKNPVHYNLYKQGSGRAGFIKKFWSK